MAWRKEVAKIEESASSSRAHRRQMAGTELVERVREGDRGAFGELVRRYMRRAYSVAYRVLQHPEDAEDLVQESFGVALERIDQFQDGRPFGPWLYRIVVNRGLNAREARARSQGEPLAPELVAAGMSPERQAELAELRDHLRSAFETLSPRQRTIARLFELEEFSGEEIGQMMGISAGTVRWHLHQARARLREALLARREDR